MIYHSKKYFADENKSLDARLLCDFAKTRARALLKNRSVSFTNPRPDRDGPIVCVVLRSKLMSVLLGLDRLFEGVAEESRLNEYAFWESMSMVEQRRLKSASTSPVRYNSYVGGWTLGDLEVDVVVSAMNQYGSEDVVLSVDFVIEDVH